MASESDKTTDFLQQIKADFADYTSNIRLVRDHYCLRIAPEHLAKVVEQLKSKYDFSVLLNVTAVDYLDDDFSALGATERFDVVYHLLSIVRKHRVRIKVAVPEKSPEIDSLFSFYHSANFMEREVWDMYGIKFRNHPDLRRILMYKEFQGHPLRKDYPVQAKQPRVKLIHPEVENTARLMNRPELVQINKNDRLINDSEANNLSGSEV